MTRAQRRRAERRAHALWVLAVALFLCGTVAVTWLVIERDRLYGQLSHEADLRGEAVSTLAGDVRALRAQVKAKGGTPVAPDPTKAVDDLPRRAEVPVPIPGPPGPSGAPGPSGSPGSTGKAGADGKDGETGVPGAVGPSGAAGQQGVPGPAGPQGEPGPAGQDGKDGADGRDGQTCPDGYSLQAPSYDADALVCRKDGAPQPGGSGNGNGGLLSMGLDPTRRQYV